MIAVLKATGKKLAAFLVTVAALVLLGLYSVAAAEAVGPYVVGALIAFVGGNSAVHIGMKGVPQFDGGVEGQGK